MALALNNVMDGLGAALEAVPGLRVKDYDADTVEPPAAIVPVPEIDFDFSMGRGSDMATFRIMVLVARVSDRGARDALAAFVAGSANSIKETLEAHDGPWDTLRVARGEPLPVTVSGIEYLTYTFVTEVIS